MHLVDAIATMPADWKNSFAHQSHNAMRGDAAKKWLEMDLEAVGFNKSDSERIGTYAAQHLIRDDPDLVFSKFDSLNLDERRKDEFFQLAFSKLKETPEKAEQLISKLGSEQDRIAAKARLDLLKVEDGSQKKKPTDWIQSLGNLEPSGSSAYQFSTEADRWDEKQVAEFRSGFNDLAANEKQNVAMAIASRVGNGTGNESLTSDAINYLVRNQTEAGERRQMRNETSLMASQFALSLASKDLSSASAWMKSLPEGDAKRWSYRNVAKDLNQYDPAAVRQWVKTLSAAERKDVEGYLKE